MKDQITSSYLKQEKNPKWNIQGFYRCLKCKACKEAGISRKCGVIKDFSNTHSNKIHKIREHLTCDAINVVYLLECPCGLRYIGRTSRKCKTRINEHF